MDNLKFYYSLIFLNKSMSKTNVNVNVNSNPVLNLKKQIRNKSLKKIFPLSKI